ncbi:hypothetical protein AALO_G00098810 [Alosa alosa]|uniref:lysozyme n=1 Tax=Alosa alosa TaxID=278164 RepID=A0AAV6GY40_9TELE|nr:uncharacterized protein LOC125298152 [Alosa alosa]KAG5278421.1 hypothetical protein AALO_G00098810 [Alosa alosa]
MRTTLRAGMLAALAVLAMVVGNSEAVVLSKCEVKNHMQEVFNRTRLLMIDTEDLMAKIVCHVELTSGFNTSVENQLTFTQDSKGSGSQGGRRRGRRSAGAGGSRFAISKFMGSNSEEGSGDSSSSSSSSSSEESAEQRGELWTLYGIFQLSDRVMCNSSSVPSLNICQMDCQAFLDDDIADDIACAVKIIHKMMSNPDEQTEAKALLKKMMPLLFQPECSAVKYKEFFAACQ